MNRYETARDHLAAWQRARPDNFFSSDPDLERVLRLYLGDVKWQEVRPRLARAGEDAANVVDPAVEINERPHNHPKLERWSPTGERIESVEFHPSYHVAGQPIYESGILALQAEPGHALEQAALLYLFGQCGEAGHLCPVVCTAGLIRALQSHALQGLQDAYLPPLLDPNYDNKHTGAQSLTEIQGGSDVGANAMQATAVPETDLTWKLNGEKWFFSNATAEQILITARPDGAPEGTRGLGLFLVPRRLPDGSLNGIYLRRLKRKFGTRAMASAELDLRDAIGYQIGEIDQGIHIVLEQVLNTSRWLNALGSLGAFRRAYVEARNYARHRAAFGNAIIHYPLVQEALAEMQADLVGGLATTWRLSHLVDRMDLCEATDRERAVFRMLVNLNKVRTSLITSLGIRRAQEVFGGNGAIEDFSPLPRLYGDAVVYESWEGSHNMLAVQMLRDMQRYGLHEELLVYLRAHLDRITADALSPYVEAGLDSIDRVARQMERLLGSNPSYAQTHIRRVMEQVATATEGTFLLVEADGARVRDLPPVSLDLLEFYFNRWLRPGYDPLDDPEYTARLGRLTLPEAEEGY